MRKNIHKSKILSLLKKHHLLKISDIHKKINDVNYSTVYRNITQLVIDKKIKKIVFEKRKVMYELMSVKNQHDHFLCLNCENIEGIKISSHKLILSEKYKIFDIIIKGICRKCH